ncbi:histidine kinase [Sphingomonas sp. Leaf357]|uniref:EF-hand domain-containing protein n=1 Tax=Sphingomonas sp. Leaf357 TaxID=1736350 RepID=UPI0006F9C8AE|nr:EF-hand domain-containing protein [Sphingomonas sp. Leaf357]KQS04784.1 histidine kinase [Sphingomonas sp. Leaf357]
MWRYLAGGVAALLLVAAGVLLFKSPARSDSPLVAAPPAATDQAEGLPDTVPEASAKTREEKRFDRYDKDRDARVTREEYLAARRKAFARLDMNADGRLSFEEWAVKATTKFAEADKDRSGAMNAAEFATTAVKRKAQRPRPPCPPVGKGEEES